MACRHINHALFIKIDISRFFGISIEQDDVCSICRSNTTAMYRAMITCYRILYYDK